MPNSDLTIAATVAAELGVSAADLRLPRLISAASDAICRHLNRPSVHNQAGYVETVPGHGRPRLLLSLTPVLSVASIVMPDGSTLGASEYSIEDADLGILRRDAGWPSTALILPGMVQQDPVPGTEKRSIVVTYTGGWVTPFQGGTRTLPYDLEEACVQTVVDWYRRGPDSRAIANEALGDYSVSYFATLASSAIPVPALELLAPYRRPKG